MKRKRQETRQSSFLGMAGCSTSFFKDFASIVHPMREVQKQRKWDWNDEAKAAFKKLKGCLSEQTMLYHYVPGRETQLMVDASGTGLGACLVQRKGKDQPFQVVSYRSRAPERC